MSPADTFPAQIAAVLEALAHAAVAEICELVRREVSRSRTETETLRRKLMLTEARAQLTAHHPGNEPRRTRAGEAALSRASDQGRAQCRDADPSSDSGLEALRGPESDGGSWSCGPPPPLLLPPGSAAARPPAGEVTATVIKVEDDDESWTRPEQQRDFHVVDGQVSDTEAPPPLTNQEAADDGAGASSSTSSTSSTSSSSSTSVHKTPDTILDPGRAGSYDGVLLALQLTTQNALQEDPSCSYAATEFHFGLSETTRDHQSPAEFQTNQQRAPQIPERKEAAGRWDRSRAQGGGGGGGKAFVCNRCGKTLACRKNLKTHMRVHTGEKPFTCALCGMCFSDSSNLKRHQSVHTGEKRYGCVHCGKRFAQSGSLKVHMTVHSDCKQFRCSFCGKTFISGSHLRRHVTTHTAEKPPAPFQ